MNTETTAVSRRGALRRLSTAALVIATVTGTAKGTVGAQGTPTDGTVERAARQAIDAVNVDLATGETSPIDAVFAPDVAGHPPHRSLVTGERFSHDLAGLKAGLADIRRFFPDGAIVIDDLIASEDTVAARITFRGTLDTEALGLPSDARQPLAIGGLVYGQISEGQITEFWAYFDPSAYFDLVTLVSSAALATPKVPSGHGAATPAVGSEQTSGEQVAVTLTEFSIALAPITLRAGRPYTFVVANEGTVPHEFVIEQPGAIHEPLMDGDQMAMVEAIMPGERQTLAWTFANPGSYQLACHEPSHYEAGQVLMIDVVG